MQFNRIAKEPVGLEKVFINYYFQVVKHFKGAMRDQSLLMPYDLSEWLPEDHLARFVVDIVDKLDFSNVYLSYKGKGRSALYSTKGLSENNR